MQKGPSEKTIKICTGCEYKKSKLGFIVCVQPKIVERAIFTPDETPEWCPYNDIEVLNGNQV
jgi:hypothetical protein